MNVRNDSMEDNSNGIDGNRRLENIDVKVDVDGSDNRGRSSSDDVNNTTHSYSDVISSTMENTFTYRNPGVPPVYMSTLAQSPSYDHFATQVSSNDVMKFTANNEEYQVSRQYQMSPPDIDKAPSFVTRMVPRSADQDTPVNNVAPPSPSTTPPEDKHVWTKQEVELLLDLYETYKEQLKDPRVRKTKIWEDIAQIIRDRLESDVNGCQCNQKFRNLKADFQKVVEHNGRPGTFKRVCKYYDRLANILNYPPQHMTTAYQVSHPPHTKNEHREMEFSRAAAQRDMYYINGHTSPSLKIPSKRKSIDTLHFNGVHNGPADSYYPAKKLRPSCNCECGHEITTLRDTIERINNYIVSRAAHEEERMRRVEEMHREKLIAIGRFVDIFKDFIHKLT